METLINNWREGLLEKNFVLFTPRLPFKYKEGSKSQWLQEQQAN